MRGGTRGVYYRKLYPGYVFVEMATEPDGAYPDECLVHDQGNDRGGGFHRRGRQAVADEPMATSRRCWRR